MKALLKGILRRTWQPLVNRYLSVDRRYHYRDIDLVVKSGVFHPAFFFSSKLLLKFLSQVPLGEKIFLELGAGSGLLAIYAARRGARVTATDISRTAVLNIIQNAHLNCVSMTILESDLFQRIPPQTFDIIVINPPYYPQTPVEEQQYAWYCGQNHEYFSRLFTQLAGYTGHDTQVYMILSEESDLATIQRLAAENRLCLKVVFQKRICWEKNYIFTILPAAKSIPTHSGLWINGNY